MLFSDLGLNSALMGAIARQGYDTPTPIQQRAIPAVLEGHDLLAAAQTGTGKTAAFTLPVLHGLMETRANQPRDGRRRTPRALILTPTRELAAQVADSVRTYGSDLPLKSTVIFGGVSAVPQIRALQRGVDLLIATPGRLLDLFGQGEVDLSRVEVLVLDEADRMLDMGFIHDIRRVISELPQGRQNLLFSATFSNDIRKLAQGLLREPVEIEVAPRNTTAELIEQKVVFVARQQKRDLLSWLIGSNNWRQVLVFMRTKHGANRLAEQLEKDGLQSAALHGNKSQAARTKALAGFKNGKVRVLVATDIAARGLDIDQLPHVINYELPNVAEDYVHRIGRTGRAGTSGEALSLVSMEERPFLRDITRLIGREIPELALENFHLVEEKAGKGGAAEKPARRPGRGHKPAERQGPSGKSGGQARNRHGQGQAKKARPQRAAGEQGGFKPVRRRAKAESSATGHEGHREANGNQRREPGPKARPAKRRGGRPGGRPADAGQPRSGARRGQRSAAAKNAGRDGGHGNRRRRAA